MGGLRVIVGEEDGGPRSQLWRIWTGEKTSDVYVGARPIAGEVRASLHESGRWRFGFTDTHQRRPGALIGPDEDRARYKWDRPAEFAPGLTRAFTIVVPASELRARSGPDPLQKPAVWLPPPPDGTQVEIDLFLTRNMDPASWPGRRSQGTGLLLRQALPTGEDLVVTSRVTEPTDDELAQLQARKREAVEAQRDVLIDATHDGSDLRGVLFGMPGPGAPADLACWFTDVALPRPEADEGPPDR